MLDRDCKVILTGHDNGVRCVAFAPDGSLLATGGDDRSVRLWRLPDGQPLNVLGGHGDMVFDIGITPDGRRLVSVTLDSDMVRLWQLPDGHQVELPKAKNPGGHCLAVDPRGRFVATGGLDDRVWFWSLPDLRLLGKTLVYHAGYPTAVVVSPDGDTVISADRYGRLLTWDYRDPAAATSVLASDYKLGMNGVLGLAISPDGRVLASAMDDGFVILRELPGGQKLGTLTGHSNAVMSVAISPNGRLLASGSWDQTIRLWRLPDGQALEVLKGHTDRIHRVAFSHDGRLLASVSRDRTARLWTVFAV